MGTVNRMVLFLKTRANEKETLDLPLIQQSAENLVHCLKNVLRAGALIATVKTANASISDIQDQVSNYITWAEEFCLLLCSKCLIRLLLYH